VNRLTFQDRFRNCFTLSNDASLMTLSICLAFILVLRKDNIQLNEVRFLPTSPVNDIELADSTSAGSKADDSFPS